MALGTPVSGAAAYSASAGTTVTPAYPAGILSTDAVLLFVGQKPSTANGGTVTTPAGWTLRDELTAAGGYGTTLGADTGNTNLRVYSWNSPVNGQTGTLSVTLGGNGVSWAFMVRVPTGGGALSYGSADGQRTTTPTSPMSIALTNGATATNFQTGDKAIWAMCIPTDVTTPSQFSAEAITATGAVFATATEINEPDSATGSDIGGYSAYSTVNSGSSTTAPTVTATLAGTLTNVRGPVVLVRIREAAPAAITGDMAATETGNDTAAIDGSVIVQGSGAASETGSDTLAATGSVTDASITGTMAATETGADTLASTGEVLVQGSFAATETGSDTLAGAGKVIVSGSFAANEAGADTLASTGKVVVAGSFAATETGSDTLAGTGKAIVQGSLAATETGSDTLAATGDVLVSGSMAATETGADTAAATGKVIVQGAGSATETGLDVLSASGGSVVAGAMAASETGTDALAATGSVASSVVSGSMAATETGLDIASAAGTVLVSGSGSALEMVQDTASASGQIFVRGSMAATESEADYTALQYYEPGYIDESYVAGGPTGKVLVQGAMAATETGLDILIAMGPSLATTSTGGGFIVNMGRMMSR